jgi:hypothetical protein
MSGCFQSSKQQLPKRLTIASAVVFRETGDEWLTSTDTDCFIEPIATTVLCVDE